MSDTLKINRLAFSKAFNDMKHKKHMTSIDVANNAHLSKSFVYHSTKSIGGPVEIKTVVKIGKGLKMTSDDLEEWLLEIIHDYIPWAYRRYMFKLKDEIENINTLPNFLESHMTVNNLSLKNVANKSGIPLDILSIILNGSNKYSAKHNNSRYVENRGQRASLKLSVPQAKGLAKALDVQIGQICKAQSGSLMLVNSLTAPRKHIYAHKSQKFDPEKVHFEQPSGNIDGLSSHLHNNRPNKLRPNIIKTARAMNRLSDADVAILDTIIQRMQSAEDNENNRHSL